PARYARSDTSIVGPPDLKTQRTTEVGRLRSTPRSAFGRPRTFASHGPPKPRETWSACEAARPRPPSRFQAPSKRRRISFTALGFPLPPVSFITAPTKKPNSLALPPRKRVAS